MTYDREIKYAHPFIQDKINDILAAIQGKLPAGITCKYISVHRTPADQFELYKQGRAFKNGKWVVVDKSKVVTGKDGFINKSRHNYLPSTAFDIGLFDSKGRYLPDSPHYKKVKEGEAFGFDWGGDWTTLVDEPHLEITPASFFQKNIEKDNGFVWQTLLQKAGTYQEVLDGIFGAKSLTALEAATGEKERNLKAWDILSKLIGKTLEPPILDADVKALDVRGGRPMPKGDRPRQEPVKRPTPPPPSRPHP